MRSAGLFLIGAPFRIHRAQTLPAHIVQDRRGIHFTLVSVVQKVDMEHPHTMTVWSDADEESVSVDRGTMPRVRRNQLFLAGNQRQAIL